MLSMRRAAFNLNTNQPLVLNHLNAAIDWSIYLSLDLSTCPLVRLWVDFTHRPNLSAADECF